MRKLSLIALIFVGLLFGGSFFVGSKIEQVVRQQVDNVNTSPSYEIQILSYHRGLLSSEAEFSLNFILPEEYQVSLAESQIKVKQHIQHGPLLWQSDRFGIGLMDSTIDFELPESLQQGLAELQLADQKVLFISSRTQFDLSSTTHLTLNEFQAKDHDADIMVKAAKGYLKYDAQTMNSQARLAANFNWGGMQVNPDQAEQLQLGEISMNTEQTLVSGQMFSPTAITEGYFNLTMNRLDVAGAQIEENFSMNNFKINVTSAVVADLLNIGVLFNIEKLAMMGMSFDQFVYDLKLDSLDLASIKTVSQLLAEAEQADPYQLSSQLQAVLPAIIERNPMFKIERFGMTTQEGDIDSNLTISVDQSIYDPNNPMTMMFALVAEGEGFAPEKFLNELGLQQEIEDLLAQNLIKRNAQNLAFEFSFKNGQALLNGTAIPLSGF